MENQNPGGQFMPGPNPAIAVTELLQRQLSDWKQLLADLQKGQVLPEQVAYCEKQVERLMNELSKIV